MAYVIRIRAPRRFYYVLLLRKSFFSFLQFGRSLASVRSEVFLAEDYVLEVLGAKSPFQLGCKDGQAY